MDSFCRVWTSGKLWKTLWMLKPSTRFKLRFKSVISCINKWYISIIADNFKKIMDLETHAIEVEAIKDTYETKCMQLETHAIEVESELKKKIMDLENHLTEDMFVDTQPLIRSVLDGYNVCIFAYSQTGSGKTYTMTGPNVSSQ
ncbi:hypothetical protein LXL04_004053 [Taraxacum kok-saghyz]